MCVAASYDYIQYTKIKLTCIKKGAYRHGDWASKMLFMTVRPGREIYLTKLHCFVTE